MIAQEDATPTHPHSTPGRDAGGHGTPVIAQEDATPTHPHSTPGRDAGGHGTPVIAQEAAQARFVGMTHAPSVLIGEKAADLIRSCPGTVRGHDACAVGADRGEGRRLNPQLPRHGSWSGGAGGGLIGNGGAAALAGSPAVGSAGPAEPAAGSSATAARRRWRGRQQWDRRVRRSRRLPVSGDWRVEARSESKIVELGPSAPEVCRCQAIGESKLDPNRKL